MPLRSGRGYLLRVSEEDGLGCSRKGCSLDEPCRCMPCSLCERRTPKWVLDLSIKVDSENVWIGPHCIQCDIQLFAAGRHIASERMGFDRQY